MVFKVRAMLLSLLVAAAESMNLVFEPGGLP